MLTFFIKLIPAIIFVALIIGCSDSNPVDSEEEHFEAIGLFILSGMDTIAKYQDLEVSGSIQVTENDSTDILNIKFIEEDGHIGIPPTDDWALDWSIANENLAEVISTESQLENYQIRFSGISAGQTSIRILINHLGHKDYESADIPLIVNSGD
jgi:hypothetical protein